MDILSIFLALWRHKLAALLVFILTAGGVSYVVMVQPSQYETTATLLLVPPPGPPSNDAIAADPSLGGARFDNPYTRVYDPAVVISVVATFVGSEQTRDRLVQAGADRRYSIAQTARYGFNSPVVEIRSISKQAALAQQTAQMVIAAFQEQLTAIQASEGVDGRFHIGTRIVDPPGPGIVQASGKLRGMLAVVGLGILALFTVVSTADAIERAREDRRSGGYKPPRHSSGPSPMVPSRQVDGGDEVAAATRRRSPSGDDVEAAPEPSPHRSDQLRPTVETAEHEHLGAVVDAISQYFSPDPDDIFASGAEEAGHPDRRRAG